MNLPEDPPAMQKMLAFGFSKLFLEIFQHALLFQVALDLLFQRLQHARHRDQHGNSFAANGAYHFAGLEGILKDHGAAHQLRQKHSEELPENMAQRKEVQKTNGMDEALVLQIFLDLCFKRSDIAENIAVRDHHALRF